MIRFLAYLFAIARYDLGDSIRSWWRRHIIDDVPEHLDRCESCRVVNCDCTKVTRYGCDEGQKGESEP